MTKKTINTTTARMSSQRRESVTTRKLCIVALQVAHLYLLSGVHAWHLKQHQRSYNFRPKTLLRTTIRRSRGRTMCLLYRPVPFDEESPSVEWMAKSKDIYQTNGDHDREAEYKGPGWSNATATGRIDRMIENECSSQMTGNLDYMDDDSRSSGTFGDIMSPETKDESVLFRDGLVTSSTYSLSEMYGITHPLDRMAITANGNLQRLFSSYYDAPVTVVVDYCNVRGGKKKEQSSSMISSSGNRPAGTTMVWDRKVRLLVDDQTLCTAVSVIEVYDPKIQVLIESGKVGIGQLFRHFDILPEFELQDAGLIEEGGFWRDYTLSFPQYLSCSIKETFVSGVWSISKK